MIRVMGVDEVTDSSGVVHIQFGYSPAGLEEQYSFVRVDTNLHNTPEKAIRKFAKDFESMMRQINSKIKEETHVQHS